MTHQILVVDDDPNATALLQFAFQMEAPDISVEYILNGKEAINYLQAKPPYESRQLPALLLLDLRMPGLDGFDVLEWLKRCPTVRPGYIMVFSTSGQETDVDHAWKLGADAYLVKPGGFDDLRKQVSVMAHFARKGSWPDDKTPGAILRRTASR